MFGVRHTGPWPHVWRKVSTVSSRVSSAQGGILEVPFSDFSCRMLMKSFLLGSFSGMREVLPVVLPVGFILRCENGHDFIKLWYCM